MTDFKKRYEESWDQFVEQISSLSQELINAAASEEAINLHEILGALQSVPYYRAPGIFKSLDPSDSTRHNIGSITGTFFEIVVASLVVGYVKKYIPEISVQLNSCSHASIGKVSRDPDICITYQDRHVIFEVKVSPKTNDLNRIIGLRNSYDDLQNAKYFLIGGNVTTNKECLGQLKGWSCFTSGSGINVESSEFFQLDSVLHKAVQFLKSIE